MNDPTSEPPVAATSMAHAEGDPIEPKSTDLPKSVEADPTNAPAVTSDYPPALDPSHRDAATQGTNGTPIKSERDPFNRRVRRKLKLEAVLTSGLGKNKEKQRHVEVFWDIVWPALETAGWTKIPGTGHHEGSVVFAPPGVQPKDPAFVKGVHYYDRLRDVLDRLNDYRNESELQIANAFKAEVQKRTDQEEGRGTGRGSSRLKANSTATPTRITRRRLQLPLKHPTSETGSPILDLSWKDGGRHYPKHSSQVGPEYQVEEFPQAGTYQPYSKDDPPFDLIWDPNEFLKANQAMRTELDQNVDPIAKVPFNKKEEALVRLHERGYDLTGFDEEVRNIKPVDGSDWSKEKKEKFHRETFKHRKDLRAVALAMNITMKECLTYYFGHFKKSDDYRLCKTVCAEERLEQMAAAEFGTDSCAICDDGGNLLICDGCEGEFHMTCLKPMLKVVPEGHWECDDCVDRKLLEARDNLIQYSGIFQRQESKKRKLDEMADNETSQDDEDSDQEKVAFIPTENVMQAVRSFAEIVSNALSPPATMEVESG